jgi:hypothetical protein
MKIDIESVGLTKSSPMNRTKSKTKSENINIALPITLAVRLSIPVVKE